MSHNLDQSLLRATEYVKINATLNVQLFIGFFTIATASAAALSAANYSNTQVFIILIVVLCISAMFTVISGSYITYMYIQFEYIEAVVLGNESRDLESFSKQRAKKSIFYSVRLFITSDKLMPYSIMLLAYIFATPYVCLIMVSSYEFFWLAIIFSLISSFINLIIAGYIVRRVW